MSTTNSSAKNYPVTTSEVAKMLGISSAEDSSSLSSHNLPIKDLPIVEEHSGHNDHGSSVHSSEANLNSAAHGPEDPKTPRGWLSFLKAVGPYLAIFIVGIFLYYFFFTNVNFGGLFQASSTPAAVTPKQTALQSLEQQSMVGYQAWINGFYYDVSDPKITDPDADNSGNGLSNFQKYLLNLNPKSYDTLGLGKPDSQTLAEGINPLTGGNLTADQKAVLDKYVDMEVVMNRLTLSNLQNPNIASPSTNTYNQTIPNPQTTNINNGFSSSISNTSTPTGSVGIRGSAPVTGANIPQSVDSNVDINTEVPGRLEIPDLKINVPIIWTKNPNDFDTDLQSGVVHYPGTALPGQIGTTYIAGHSSNYVWAKGNYNRVFSTLGNLADNTSFKITVVSKTGKDVIFQYVVLRRQEYLPTDQAQFANSGESIVALSTCWPVNSTAKRLVVFGKLTQVVR